MKAEMHNHSAWIDETDPKVLHKYFSKMLKIAGFDVLSMTENHFKPQGYTSLYLLSESHFAIHTFPEHNRTYIELSSCVKQPFDKFLRLVLSD